MAIYMYLITCSWLCPPMVISLVGVCMGVCISTSENCRSGTVPEPRFPVGGDKQSLCLALVSFPMGGKEGRGRRSETCVRRSVPLLQTVTKLQVTCRYVPTYIPYLITCVFDIYYYACLMQYAVIPACLIDAICGHTIYLSPTTHYSQASSMQVCLSDQTGPVRSGQVRSA